MSIKLNGTLVLAGAGKMGSAMLEGWLKAGADPAKIVAIDPKPPSEVVELLQRHGIRHNPAIISITDTEVIIVAVKPQVMDEVLPNLVPLQATQPLILSVAAGKTIATFAKYFGAGAYLCAAQNSGTELVSVLNYGIEQRKHSRHHCRRRPLAARRAGAVDQRHAGIPVSSHVRLSRRGVTRDRIRR